MEIAIIVSRDCPAGNNTKDCLLEVLNIDSEKDLNNNNNKDNKIKKDNKNTINKIINISDNTKLYIINKKHVFAENLDKEIKADLFIFATTHKSEKGTPSLSVHTQGNWGKAELGGMDRELCVAPCFFLKESLIMLEKFNNTKFEVMQECTHHGPFIRKPSMFIEIGSSEKEWSDKDAGIVNAKVIKHLVDNADEISKKAWRSAFGVGGLHHTPNFKRIILETDIAIGHVCPKYNLENLDEKMLRQAIERAVPKARFAIVDWKGLGGFKNRVKDLLEKNNIAYKKTKEI